MISGDRILWNAFTLCKMSKTSWQTGNLEMNWSGESLKGPIVLFGALVGYLPKTPRETKHELIKLEENYYEGFCWLCFFRGEILGRRYSDYWCLKNWKIWRRWNIFQKTKCKRSLDNPKRCRIYISCGWWFSKIIREKTTNSQNPHWDGKSTVRRENLSGESHGDRDEFQLEETKDDEGINKDFCAHAEARTDF